MRRDKMTVAEDTDGIRNLRNFIQFMRNVDNAFIFAFKLSYNGKKLIPLPIR